MSRPPHHRPPTSDHVLVALAALALSLGTSPGPIATAQDWLEAAGVLDASPSFRARARAAFLLGETADANVVRHLARALREDPHPAVRTAAAAALGTLGALPGVPPLRDAKTDPARAVRLQVERSLREIARHQATIAASADAAVQDGAAPAAGGGEHAELAGASGPREWRRVRRVVVVGEIDNRTDHQLDDLENRVRGELTRRLARVPGTLVFPSPASVSEEAAARMERDGLPRLRVETHWTTVERSAEEGDVSVRCSIQLLLLAEPAETLRGTLEGAVTARATGSVDDQRHADRLTLRALVGAVRAALSDATEALDRAAPTRGSPRR